MTVGSVIIKPHESIKNWYHLIFVSRKDSIGETTIEFLASEETLRFLRYTIDQTLTKDKDHE